MIKKILIVDEDRNERKIIKHSLSVAGYNIIESESSSSALLAISNHPDINMIIVNWSLDDSDETSTFNILHDNFSSIPIFVISNDESNNAIITALKLGAVDYIIKPINKDLLTFKVNNILNKDRNSLLHKSATRKQVLFNATSDITLTSITKQSVTFNTHFAIPKDTITTFTCHDLAEKLDIPFKSKFSCKITDSELINNSDSNFPFYRISAEFRNLSPLLASKIQDAISKNKFNPKENQKGFI